MFDSMALSEISDRSIAVMVGISQFFLPCLFFLLFLVSGCSNLRPAIESEWVKKPLIEVFLVDSTVYRLVGGVSGEVGLSHKSAVRIADALCASQSGHFVEVSWTTRPLLEGGGENTIRRSQLEFSCTKRS